MGGRLRAVFAPLATNSFLPVTQIARRMATAEVTKDDDGFISSVDVVDLTDKLSGAALAEKETLAKRSSPAVNALVAILIAVNDRL